MLALSGLTDGFHSEVAGTINAVGASSWVMSPSAHGRFTVFAAFPESAEAAVAREPGVQRASAVLFAPEQVVLTSGSSKPLNVNLMGVQRGGLGDPQVVVGHGFSGSGEAVVDSRLKAPVGSTLEVGGHGYQVVGMVDGRTMDGGNPIVFMPLAAVQQAVTGGRPPITAVAVDGTPTNAPPGLVVLAPSRVVSATVAALGARSPPSTARGRSCGSWRRQSSPPCCTLLPWSGNATSPCSRHWDPRHGLSS